MKQFMLIKLFLLSCLLGAGFQSSSQGIRGYVRTQSGEALPDASIFISKQNIGSSTNKNGEYLIKLGPGTYSIRVGYVGYQSVQYEVTIAGSWVEKDFVLQPQSIVLSEVAVGRGRKEDLANTIMRKTIARRKYHLLRYNGYQVTNYTKGTAEITKAPFFIRNRLKREGLRLNEAYTLESVSKIHFRQPNKIQERVLSVRSKGENNTSIQPSMFINQSFYKDRIAKTIISPLAGSAFAYYQFSYAGSFTDKDLLVYKIKVTPRSKGDNVFDGFINIIDEEWALHSVDLKTSVMGFPVSLKQNYAEVARAVWMPVTQQFRVSGNMLGFKGYYNFLVSSSNYKVDLNKQLVAKNELLDEQADELPAGLDKKLPASAEQARAMLAGGKPLTRRQYAKAIEAYEKEQLKKRPEDEQKVVSDISFKIDPMAAKRDSLYWDCIRPVPLTLKEKKGYHRDDSLALAKQDTLKQPKKDKALSLLVGGRLKLSKKAELQVKPLLMNTQFNTVEGVNFNAGGSFNYRPDTLRTWSFSPDLKYGISSRQFYGKGRIAYQDSLKKMYVEGGRFSQQFNSENPIHPYVNTLNTLFLRRNYMKLYDKTFAGGGVEFSLSEFFKFSGSLEWSERRELFNTNEYSFLFKDKRNFTSNAPQNIELTDPSFPVNQAAVIQAGLMYRPIKRYIVRNGKKIALTEGLPRFMLTYRKGLKKVLGSDVDYDFAELEYNQSVTIGAGNRLAFEARGGTFLNNNSTYFMDYKHFYGNPTFLTSINPAGSFRLMNFYDYSTNNSYISGHLHYQFRKLLFTRIPEIRYMGLKENLFFNYLKTTHSPNYFEAGYTLDNIFRMFRVEAAVSFTDLNYREVGFQLGISTLISFRDK